MKNTKNQPNPIKIIVNCFLILATLCFIILGAENMKPILASGNPITIECSPNETNCDLIILQSDIHQELAISTASTIVVTSFASTVISIGILAIYNKH